MGHYSTLCSTIIINQHIKNRINNGDKFVVIPTHIEKKHVPVKGTSSLRNVTNRQIKQKQPLRIEFTTSGTSAYFHMHFDRLIKAKKIIGYFCKKSNQN